MIITWSCFGRFADRPVAAFAPFGASYGFSFISLAHMGALRSTSLFYRIWAADSAVFAFEVKLGRVAAVAFVGPGNTMNRGYGLSGQCANLAN